MRFRFTIRDLLWLTLVVALCVAWYLDRGRKSETWIIQQRDGATTITNKDNRQDVYWFNRGQATIGVGGAGGTHLLFEGWQEPPPTAQGYGGIVR